MTPSPRSGSLSWVARGHHAIVFGRRTRVIAEALAPLIPRSASVLDIGCGDGTIALQLTAQRRDIAVEGVEFVPRPTCRIPCRRFDGARLPFPDRAFDACLLVDVLHHTKDSAQLLREAARVSRTSILVKDHLNEMPLDRAILGVMDWVGNRPHGVPLTYNYQSLKQWQAQFTACGLQAAQISAKLPLYPMPFSLLFGRRLHFVAQLHKL